MTAPLKLLLLLLLAATIAAGWFYRHEIAEYVRHRMHPVAADGGKPGVPRPAALARARADLAALSRGHADSTVLDADEMASLVRQALGADVAGQVDSMRLDLGTDRLTLRGMVRTARLPHELLGPLAIGLHSAEPVEASGTVTLLRPGVAGWSVDRLRVRDFPIPREAIPGLVSRAFGDSARRIIGVPLPSGVAGIRVAPTGVILYARQQR